ncbi:MAG: glycine--tRNA ligase subunit beta [Firmicutes bacterium]|nr:glycine--tRNA ligase subunit beta [Bacillota bacterium]
MSNPAFLVEVGVEEIPSRYVKAIATSWQTALEAQLREARLWRESGHLFYTPRRLVFETTVAPLQAAEAEVIRGPKVADAWRDGQPTSALLGFARRVQIPVEQLEQEVVAGKEYVVARVAKPQAAAHEVLPELVARSIGAIALPRSMRWGSGDARFIRPVRWLLMLLDDRLLTGEVLGVKAISQTYGNRTDHPAPIVVRSAAAYWSALAEGKVEADAERRRQVIRDQGEHLAMQVGGHMDVDPDLLEEVVNLVEWPTPFVGTFDATYLTLPESLLITTMRVHQRYFPVRTGDGRLAPYFVAVRNGVGEALDQVRRGNEKVLRARLADAQYFYELDCKIPLRAHQAGLANVLLHQELGTYLDKIQRVHALYRETQDDWQLPREARPWVERAIDLYKCDLLTHVVGEFPELQGEMGGIYAALDHEPEAVQWAIRDQYRPAFVGDRLPEGPVGQLLGVLDRLDTLVVFYAHGIKASGSEDPFGLRRAALGLARLAYETSICGQQTVRSLVERMGRLIGASPDVIDDVYALILSRLSSLLEAAWPSSLVASVLAVDAPWSQLADRLRFFQAVLGTPEWDAFQEAYRRVVRILGGETGPESAGGDSPAEVALNQAVEQVLAVPEGDVRAWWRALGGLIPAIHRFFEDVLVMDPDPLVRERRVGLLRKTERALTRYGLWER